MAIIKVVTDSGADLPPSVAAELNITVVPLAINFESERFRDGVDISPDVFYDRLRAGEHPSTTQPSPADFAEVYAKIGKEADVIISCHLSGEMSGTVQSAALASRESDVPVHVLDTRSASMGIGHIAVEAARMAQEGMDVEHILSRLQSIIERQKALFIVDTLEYLQRNGRIGRAQAFVGGLLNIKPLLTLEDGVVSPLERARGRVAALGRLFDSLAAQYDDEPIYASLVHADVAEEAERVKEQLMSRFNVQQLIVTQLGPTIGTHTGPGTLGVVCYSAP